MWFGTRNGLNRYDGYTFDVYASHAGDPGTLTDGHIMCMTEDGEGRLWIGTNNGLNCLDLSTGKVKRYYAESGNPASLSHNTILSLCRDTSGNLWIGTSLGVNLYDPATDKFRTVSIENLLPDRINVITCKEDLLYVGTLSQGLFIYDTKTQRVERYTANPNDPSALSDNYVKAICMDKDENLWVGTQYSGLNRQKKGSKGFVRYNMKNGLTNDYIRSITQSPTGAILVATFNGLNVIDPEKNEIDRYSEYGVGQGNLSHYSVISLYFDRSETLWVGTYAGGVCYYNRYGQKFRFYDPVTQSRKMLGIFGPIVETPRQLYIGTEGGGLLEMDKEAGTFRNYEIVEGADPTYERNIVKSLYLDGDHLLCGTNVGTIYRFDLKTKKFSLFYDSKREHSFYYIGRSKSGDLILAGVGAYGFQLLSRTGTLGNEFPLAGGNTVVFPDVRCVLEMNTNVFLIGTRNNGLYYYDYNTYILKQYKHDPSAGRVDDLPENYISSMIRDKKGRVWIGTFGGGLSLFDPVTEKFITYNTGHELPDNNICRIEEDTNGHLWISTIRGISDFNPETEEFRNYTHANGIRVDEFTIHSGLRLSNQDIIFSGNNGMVSFNPQRMTVNPYIPPIILKNVYVNNRKVVPGEDDHILQKQLEMQKEITLKYNQSNLSIEYSALNYLFPDRNQYTYKLEGFDKEWEQVGSRRFAYYTNIPPGEYRFVVRGSNNDGLWNDEGNSLRITILPPYWKTGWAYAVYILITAGIIWAIFRYFRDRKRLQDDIKMKQIEARAREEFHEARNNLFTNFSHELRTPLTLIISPLDDLASEEFSPPVKSKIELMRNNAQRLLRLVNNLMDFQKKESGMMKLNLSESDFTGFAEDMVRDFAELAESRNIRLSFRKNVNALNCSFDRNLMEKVFFNFLSNAFKNTPDNGSVGVCVEDISFPEIKKRYSLQTKGLENEHTEYVLVEIKDSGEGIAREELENIFIPFYQVAQNEHSASGTGIGLSLSKSIIEMHQGIVWAESPEGSGAIFICILPVNKNSMIHKEPEVEYELTVSEPVISESGVDEGRELKTKKKQTILIVEDNKDVKEYIISHLQGKYNILTASNGSEGIDKAVLHQPDLIISDLMMPKMDGMQMCSRIKNDIRTSHIPVIMLTARVMTDDIKQGYEAGADDYIPKPFNASLLLTRVDNIIRSREKLKEIYGKRFSLETLGVEATSTDERFMQKLYDLLEKNVANSDLTLDDLTRELGMSRANLYRKIKSITDLSPNEFIRNFRLNMGSRLLKEAKLTVSDVYVAVGFNSHAYFSNCFKAHFGVSPTEYASQTTEEEK